ncbi:hypothetical protein DFR24_2296 [Panacagrimonas perspica]|uniref:Outer membrane beta-barrel porin/alpha-amylase n=1 Tax=Panacagrimonas perspica TaxID=381431 RepID=A0A4V3F797_9GAMM|nr:hypothetical protein [Panacagrimonas perspica]TDU32886.1 hypothetical protein DFR24_2296 [Panacagrimonas perspica]THD00995.1 hypothetical protein B1810_22350 [Panacagrimonas perspica]
MKLKAVAATFALNAISLAVVTANAQGSAISVPQSAPNSYAGASFGSPLAFGADWGAVGIGVYGQTLPNKFNGAKLDTDEDFDGSAAIVFGLGDADKYVGLETAIVTTSLTGSEKLTGNDSDEFGESGGLSFKLHTNVPGGAALAIGVIGTGRWGEAEEQNESSVFANATKVFSIDTGSSKHALVANIGIGDGSFTSSLRDDGVNVFGSLAFYVTRQLSLIADHNGRFTNLAVSAAPIRGIPLVVTLGAVNVGERFDSDMQFGGTLGYTLSF